MFKKYILIKILILVLTLSGTYYAQKKFPAEIIDANRTRNCEFVSQIYDGFVQNIPLEKNIIIVSYKGKNETREGISRRRLYNAKIYFTEFYKNTRFFRPEDKIITALGVDETEEGKLDFYINGELQLTLLFMDDRDFGLSPCYIEKGDYCENEIKKLFYPCKKN